MTEKDIETAKGDFLREQLYILAYKAAMTRGEKIYCDSTSEKVKCFQRKLKCRVMEIANDFNNGASTDKDASATHRSNNEAPDKMEKASDDHTGKIEKLADGLTKEYGEIFHEVKGKDGIKKKQFKIGRAQKLINLYLKYLWVAGKIQTPPPHCPFDETILEQLGKKVEKWTKTDDIAQYKCWVDAACKAAKKENLSIAEWELVKYNEWVANRQQPSDSYQCL